MQVKSWLPTRKWAVTQITAAAAIIVGFIQAHDWNDTLSIAVVGLVAQASISYLVPNADTPGGVPTTKA